MVRNDIAVLGGALMIAREIIPLCVLVKGNFLPHTVLS
jgi:hypothetical protein